MGIHLTTRYKNHLASPEWKAFAMDAKVATGGRCQGCDRETWNLSVHHLTYERLGNERASDVWVVCNACHLKFHPHHKKRVNKERKRQGKGKIRGLLGQPRKPPRDSKPKPRKKGLDLSDRRVQGRLTKAADRFLAKIKSR